MSSSKHSTNIFTTRHPSCERIVAIEVIDAQGVGSFSITVAGHKPSTTAGFADTAKLAGDSKSSIRITVIFAVPKLLSTRFHTGSSALDIALHGRSFNKIVVTPRTQVAYDAHDSRIELDNCDIKAYGESGEELDAVTRQIAFVYEDGDIEFFDRLPIPAML